MKIYQSKIDIAAKKMEKYDDLLLRIADLDGKCQDLEKENKSLLLQLVRSNDNYEKVEDSV